MYSLGVDVGYATIKIILLNEKSEIVFRECIFHHGNIIEVLCNTLEKTKNEFDIENMYLGITGSHKKLLPELAVNDITATIEGAKFVNGDIKSIFEIGAQTSRFITGFSSEKESIEFSTNSSCSAGTGSFLEEQASRLDIKIQEFSQYASKATNIPRIAGRCSVFSKTDIIHHQQEGVSVEDILMGLSYALVRNFRANVVQNRIIKKPVIFVGGVAKNEGVVKAIKDVFKLNEEDFIVNKECSIIGSIGAAFIASERKQVYKIEKFIDTVKHNKDDSNIYNAYPSLSNSGSNDSKDKHICKKIKEPNIKTYLGIDIGSTSTNLVLIDENKDVLAYRYIKTKGNPKDAVTNGINSIKNEFKDRITIDGIGTTGSGRVMIGKLLNADLVVNEITAQATGAIEVDKDVDTIFEIGGQDSKYIQLKDGRVTDFEMNKICAAGTGSFIEEQAKKLNIEIEEYESVALKGKEPIDLGDRCTVFIEGNVCKALSRGESKENITAGLCYSIVNNYLNRVVAKKHIGNKIFLQGGLAHNQAIINAFRVVTGKEVIVPKFFSVTGALGVAVLTKESIKSVTSDVTKKNEDIDTEAEIEKLFLKGYTGQIDHKKKTVGIPRVLFLHKLFPMFNEFFKNLGFNVLLTDKTNQETINLAQEYSLDETCYPIKLINGHVADLVNKDVDYIFLPSLYTMRHPISKTRQDYACVYMQTVGLMVEKTMKLNEKGVKLLAPALSFKFGKKYIMKTILDLGKDLGRSKVQVSIALAKAMKRFKDFGDEVEALGEKMLSSLKKEEKAFVIITRDYGIADDGLNMKIPSKLRKMGYKVLTLSNLPAHDCDISGDYKNMYWPFGQHILSGAKLVKDNKNLFAIYLTNHGCGPDTVLSHYFKDEMGGKPYLHIEVDEHDSDVGVMTRLEAFIESLKNNDNSNVEKDKKTFEDNQYQIKKDQMIFIPYLYPYSNLVKVMLQKQGYDVDVLSKTDKKSIEVGSKYNLSKEYLSLTALTGDVFSNIDKINENSASIFIPQTEGSEVYGQYSRLMKLKLKDEGYSNVNIYSPYIEDLIEDDEYGYRYVLYVALGDVIMHATKDKRKYYLDKALEHLQNNNISEELLYNMCEEIYGDLDNKSFKKNIFALGESNIIFNEILNNNKLIKIEDNNRVMYQPISQVQYFRWVDMYKRSKKTKRLSEISYKIDKLFEILSNKLGKFSSFDSNIDNLSAIADEKLKLFSGGNGRYRIAKQLVLDNVDGILNISSMYENTGTVLKLIRDKKIQQIPTIDLCFDGSSHSDNDEKINNFIYYI